MAAVNPQDIDWRYINLDSRPDRKEHAELEFAKCGISVKRYPARLPKHWMSPLENVERMQNRTPGAIGCFMSQMHLIWRAHNEQKVVAVCEDDVCFCKDLPKRLDYIANAVTWPWDIIYLGATFHVPGKWYANPECQDWASLGKDVATTEDPRILRTYGIWGTYAYLVNPATAERTHKLFSKNIHRADGIDHLAILLGPQLHTYCFVPGCAWQYDNPSDIGDGITRFSGFKKLGPYVWADHMEDFDPTTFNWQTGQTE